MRLKRQRSQIAVLLSLVTASLWAGPPEDPGIPVAPSVPVDSSVSVHSSPSNQCLDPANTYALIVGVLEWEERALTTYDTRQRQDVALHQQLLAMGVPKLNTTLLLDRDATRKQINLALKRIARKANTESTLMVYYAGHGLLEKGQGVFASYDISTGDAVKTGWTEKQLTNTIAKHFRGKHVLLFADCCYSGFLQKAARQLAGAGFQSACITSATKRNESTGNWTFTLTLVDTLQGQPLADDNGDAIISIAEAADEVQESMQNFEKQASGFASFGFEQTWCLAHVNPNSPVNPYPPAIKTKQPVATAPQFSSGQYVFAGGKGKWQPARIIDAKSQDKTLLLRFRDYSQFRITRVPQTAVRATRPSKTPTTINTNESSQAASIEKASLDGTYTRLLKRFRSPTDRSTYGDFHHWGYWDGDTWKQHRDLPKGYWVYVHPHWYIWGDKSQPTSR